MAKKEIYSFKVEREVEVEETETKKKKNKDSGKMETIEVTKKVVQKVPNKVIIYQPNRREIEEADMEYSIEVSKCIKRGILTKAMLAKKYSDSGGMVSEEDAEFLAKKYAELNDLQNDLTRLTVKSRKNSRDKERIDTLTEDVSRVRREIIDMESSYSALFNHTADNKAQNKAILWYMLNLAHLQEDDSSRSAPIFPGETFEEKLDSYYELEDGADDVYDQIRDKLPSFVSMWYFSANPTKEDFEELDKEIDSEKVEATEVTEEAEA